MRKVLITACLPAVVVPAAWGQGLAEEAGGRERPHVIIIYADDLGYGDLQCYGAKNVRTPHVDALAEQGIRFTNVHATAATSTPSRYSLQIGRAHV